METKIINITLEMPSDWVTGFESYLNEDFKVISYKIIPDTKVLYETDKHFKKLVKKYKESQKEKDNYILNNR